MDLFNPPKPQEVLKAIRTHGFKGDVWIISWRGCLPMVINPDGWSAVSRGCMHVSRYQLLEWGATAGKACCLGALLVWCPSLHGVIHVTGPRAFPHRALSLRYICARCTWIGSRGPKQAYSPLASVHPPPCSPSHTRSWSPWAMWLVIPCPLFVYLFIAHRCTTMPYYYIAILHFPIFRR